MRRRKKKGKVIYCFEKMAAKGVHEETVTFTAGKAFSH